MTPILAALRRALAVAVEAEKALAQANADLALYREMAARAVAERDELRLEVLQLRVKRARAVA